MLRYFSLGWVVFVMCSMGVASVAWADPPPWAGGGKEKHKHQDKHKSREDRDDRYDGRRERSEDVRHEGVSINIHFGDQQRVFVRDYYAEQIRGGHCPPGLAKKHNGCLPPGQAKKWSRGRPLPKEVIYYDLPPAVVVKLGAPPAGHRYVRVASDILLIAVGTAMVVDAIEDLGR